mmetsp:Transcript_123995/g.386158  ORF Transcript_123995/g.386158 Transcript_123995/m.386158 type:complete len:230 (-) Transcript_123995:727-1416(-)
MEEPTSARALAFAAGGASSLSLSLRAGTAPPLRAAAAAALAPASMFLPRATGEGRTAPSSLLLLLEELSLPPPRMPRWTGLPVRPRSAGVVTSRLAGTVTSRGRSAVLVIGGRGVQACSTPPTSSRPSRHASSRSLTWRRRGRSSRAPVTGCRRSGGGGGGGRRWGMLAMDWPVLSSLGSGFASNSSCVTGGQGLSGCAASRQKLATSASHSSRGWMLQFEPSARPEKS